MEKKGYVYIMSNKKHGTIYVGVTNNLIRRVFEHKQKEADCFTKEHNLTKLVYFEETSYLQSALKREKQIKNWKRIWKIELIEKENPEWRDLYNDLV